MGEVVNLVSRTPQPAESPERIVDEWRCGPGPAAIRVVLVNNTTVRIACTFVGGMIEVDVFDSTSRLISALARCKDLAGSWNDPDTCTRR